MTLPPPISTLFPYTTLFRSVLAHRQVAVEVLLDYRLELMQQVQVGQVLVHWADRKSTRLNSSHPSISYAVFCLKKKKENNIFYTMAMGYIYFTLVIEYVSV